MRMSPKSSNAEKNTLRRIEREDALMTTYDLRHLDCADCAQRIECRLRTLPAVNEVSVDFASSTLSIDTDNMETVRREIEAIEPNVTLSKHRSKNGGPPPRMGLKHSILTGKRSYYSSHCRCFSHRYCSATVCMPFPCIWVNTASPSRSGFSPDGTF